MISASRFKLSDWSYLLVVLCVPAFLLGRWWGFRGAVRADYGVCAEEIHSRDLDNNDSPRGSPVPFNGWCAKHASAVYGGDGWMSEADLVARTLLSREETPP